MKRHSYQTSAQTAHSRPGTDCPGVAAEFTNQQRSFTMRKYLAIAASLSFAMTTLTPTPALAQQSNYARQQHARLCTQNPGTCIIVDGCYAVASNEFNSYGRFEDAATAFIACGGILCGLTGDYQNCISVGLRMLALRFQ